MFLPLKQLQHLKTMNVVINDLTDRRPDNCLQSRHDPGVHSMPSKHSFRWRREVRFRWAEVIRKSVLQDKIEKK